LSVRVPAKAGESDGGFNVVGYQKSLSGDNLKSKMRRCKLFWNTNDGELIFEKIFRENLAYRCPAFHIKK